MLISEFLIIERRIRAPDSLGSKRNPDYRRVCPNPMDLSVMRGKAQASPPPAPPIQRATPPPPTPPQYPACEAPAPAADSPPPMDVR